ncbi:50S ribosomal protein L15 [Bacilli bacterium]|nr:50S ribosomal protein L15 [Bacilli bacterium]
MELNNLKYTKGSRNHKEKRGRGFSCGFGKTNGRGTKGQGSRKSGNVRIGFAGGQTPIYISMPKQGFNNDEFANKYNVVSLNELRTFTGEVDRKSLIAGRIIKNNKLPIKIIAGKEDIKLSNNFTIDKITDGARKQISGNITIVEPTAVNKKNKK